MLRSLHGVQELSVEPQHLPSDTVKPGALDESVRTLEAGRRSTLLAVRKRDAKLAALGDAQDGCPALASPELTECGFNEDIRSTGSTGKGLTELGRGTLSKTRLALLQQRAHAATSAALPFAPGEPLGIHAAPLPRFSERLSPALQPWWRDKAAVEAPGGRLGAGGAGFTEVVGPLDGPAPPSRANPSTDDLPDNYRPIPAVYEASLRHTVRRAEAQGQRLSAEEMGARVDLAPPGLSAKSPRLLQDGLRREEEAVAASEGDAFKARSVLHSQLGSFQRRKGALTRSPGSVDPLALSEAAAASEA